MLNLPRSPETKHVQREAGRTGRETLNTVTRRATRRHSLAEYVSAAATSTQVSQDTRSGYDYREPMRLDPSGGRFPFYDPPGSLSNR